jgi:DDE family transposase
LADEIDLTITVTHYPTSASKWNWVEHHLFNHLSQNWAGQPLVSYETILKFIRTTRTTTGLTCTAYLDRRWYETRTKLSAEQKQTIHLRRHRVLPKWNYTINPRNTAPKT